MDRPPILLIRAASEAVLRASLARVAPGQRVVVLGHGTSDPDLRAERLIAPAGPLRWRTLAPHIRRALRRTRWSEVIVLHNQGYDAYTRVFAIALRSATWRPLHIVYADGSERCYRSTVSFVLHRTPLILFAWLACALFTPLLLSLKALAPRVLRDVHHADRC